MNAHITSFFKHVRSVSQWYRSDPKKINAPDPSAGFDAFMTKVKNNSRRIK
ncbi:hypothetical protein [Dyadobacter frigoris]|uniref:hypothetical protein n=1 Tax=Dyadobacter frigoris TaxID=2576211 RepID=UPI0014855558|nr:hypothetical protein [Dyadobacter frigoris]